MTAEQNIIRMFSTTSIVLWFTILLPVTLPVSIDNRDLLLKRHVEPNDIQFFNQGVRSSLSYIYQKRDVSDSDNEQVLRKSKKKKKTISTGTPGMKMPQILLLLKSSKNGRVIEKVGRSVLGYILIKL